MFSTTTFIALGLALFACTASARPPHHELPISDLIWNGQVVPGGLNTTISGTAQSILGEILKINPAYPSEETNAQSMTEVGHEGLEKVAGMLQRTEHDPRPVVLMTCGMAGSGKSTLSKAVINRFPQFTRLSNDEIVFQRHGLYGVDYPADMTLYQQYLTEADRINVDTVTHLIKAGKDVIWDGSFYAKGDRDEFSKMIARLGGRRVLVVFRLEKELLWQRITERAQQPKNANNALHISRELFESYWDGFEWPDPEKEEVVVLH
ncbi:hypothetical protein HJFPF1_07677 [Paramyrothecium foliicola]|nr:hypothetical protein HJFPF1_07677 [Paramyrothecium foliicola]